MSIDKNSLAPGPALARAGAESRLWQWLGGERSNPASGAFAELASPRDAQPFREAPRGDYLDVVRAVQAANKALPGWQRRDAEGRAAALERLADLATTHAESLAMDEALETGRPISLALARGVPAIARALREAAAACRVALPPGLARADGGVAGLILPAFEPALQFARRLGPLLAAGGACVAKPPSQAPRSILRLAELALEAGVPAGLVNVVCGSGNEAGEGIVAHPGIRWIAFAGSTEVGLRVGAAAIAAGKRAQLSLGSSNAAIALGDLFLSDKARAGRAARALFDIHRPAWRAARLFTQESSSPATLDALVAAAQGLRVGDPLDPSVDIGPMPSARHLAIAQAQARQALAEKGRPRIDAAAFSLPARGFYIAPQIVADFSTCSGLRQQEALGPLVAECSFKYPRHAASGANATPFGQTFYVWSEDRERGLRLAAQLECGRALVGADEPFAGSGLQARLDAGMDEFGPAKQSGLGAEGALAWLRFFSCTHAVIDAAGPS